VGTIFKAELITDDIILGEASIIINTPSHTSPIIPITKMPLRVGKLPIVMKYSHPIDNPTEFFYDNSLQWHVLGCLPCSAETSCHPVSQACLCRNTSRIEPDCKVPITTPNITINGVSKPFNSPIEVNFIKPIVFTVEANYPGRMSVTYSTETASFTSYMQYQSGLTDTSFKLSSTLQPTTMQTFQHLGILFDPKDGRTTEKYDPIYMPIIINVDCLDSSSCLNGGICENYGCRCLAGFAGEKCQLGLIPPILTFYWMEGSNQHPITTDSLIHPATQITVSVTIPPLNSTNYCPPGIILVRDSSFEDALRVSPVYGTDNMTFTLPTIASSNINHRFYADIYTQKLDSYLGRITFPILKTIPFCQSLSDGSNLCVNNGVCRYDSICTCTSGFTGIRCQQAIVIPIISLSISGQPIPQINGNDPDLTNVYVGSTLEFTIDTTVPLDKAVVPGTAYVKSAATYKTLTSFTFPPSNGSPPKTHSFTLSSIPSTYNLYIEFVLNDPYRLFVTPQIKFSTFTTLLLCFESSNGSLISKCIHGTCELDSTCRCSAGYTGHICDIPLTIPSLNVMIDNDEIPAFDPTNPTIKAAASHGNIIQFIFDDVFYDTEINIKVVGSDSPIQSLILLQDPPPARTYPFIFKYTLPNISTSYDFFVEFNLIHFPRTLFPNVVLVPLSAYPTCYSFDTEYNPIDSCPINTMCLDDSTCHCKPDLMGDDCSVRIPPPGVDLAIFTKMIPKYDSSRPDLITDANIYSQIGLTITKPTVKGTAVVKASGDDTNIFATVLFDPSIPSGEESFVSTFTLPSTLTEYNFYVEINYDDEYSVVVVDNVVFRTVQSFPTCFDVSSIPHRDECEFGQCQPDSECWCTFGTLGDYCQLKITPPTFVLSAPQNDRIETPTTLHNGSEIAITATLHQTETTIAVKGIAVLKLRGYSTELATITFDPESGNTFAAIYPLPVKSSVYTNLYLEIKYDEPYSSLVVDDHIFPTITTIPACFTISNTNQPHKDRCAGTNSFGSCQDDSTCSCIQGRTGEFCQQEITPPNVQVRALLGSNPKELIWAENDVDFFNDTQFTLTLSGLQSDDEYTLNGTATLTIVKNGAVQNAVITRHPFDSTTRTYKFLLSGQIQDVFIISLTCSYNIPGYRPYNIVFGKGTIVDASYPTVQISVPSVGNSITFVESYNNKIDYPAQIIMNADSEINFVFKTPHTSPIIDITIDFLFIPDLTRLNPINLQTIDPIINPDSILTISFKAPPLLNSNRFFFRLQISPRDITLPTLNLTSRFFTVLPTCFGQPTLTTDLTNSSKWASICGVGGYCGSDGKCICYRGWSGLHCGIPIEPDQCSPCNSENTTDECNYSTPFTLRTTPCVCKEGFGGSLCSDSKVCLSQSKKGCNYSKWGGLYETLPDGSCATNCACFNEWAGSKCEKCGLKCKYRGEIFPDCVKCGCQVGFGGERCECRSATMSMMINGSNYVIQETGGKYETFSPFNDLHSVLYALQTQFSNQISRRMNLTSIDVNFQPVVANFNDHNFDSTKIAATVLFNCDQTLDERSKEELNGDFEVVETLWQEFAEVIANDVAECFNSPQNVPLVDPQSIIVAPAEHTLPEKPFNHSYFISVGLLNIATIIIASLFFI
jgi:hypothetical protein